MNDGGDEVVISVTVYAEHPDLALSSTIRAVADADIGVVSDAGTDPEPNAHFFWIETDDFDAVDDALDRDATVASYSAIFSDENRRTYRIQYAEDAKLLTPTITALGGVTTESRNRGNGWELSIQFQDHDALYELNEFAAEEDIRLDVLELRQSGVLDDRHDFGLTESQRDALLAAYVHGYYDDPREIQLEELAALLDLSPTAVSGRLRRGAARLIEDVLVSD